ncbi:TPA: hypothetical protein R3V32_004531, partial [Enterobacter cloacae]|nr:hypothetical protein [Enterobacter cloacae]
MTVIAGRHLVAVTACVSGVAHTYMAAERLERICQQEKWSVRIETQGALGIESELMRRMAEDKGFHVTIGG